MGNPSNILPKDLLTFAAAGRLIGRSRQLISHAVSRGHLTCVEVGPYKFVHTAEVLAYKKNPPPSGWKKGEPRKYEETPEKIYS